MKKHIWHLQQVCVCGGGDLFKARAHRHGEARAHIDSLVLSFQNHSMKVLSKNDDILMR